MALSGLTEALHSVAIRSTYLDCLLLDRVQHAATGPAQSDLEPI